MSVPPKKERLDKLLHEKGLAESREKAKALVISGSVMVNGTVVDRSGTTMI
jgi:23S rRNA (cytidine1920-2'-O)/16S rRNA (cytidine1409-2'-O)-methyltransferase